MIFKKRSMDAQKQPDYLDRGEQSTRKETNEEER